MSSVPNVWQLRQQNMPSRAHKTPADDDEAWPDVAKSAYLNGSPSAPATSMANQNEVLSPMKGEKSKSKWVPIPPSELQPAADEAKEAKKNQSRHASPRHPNSRKLPEPSSRASSASGSPRLKLGRSQQTTPQKYPTPPPPAPILTIVYPSHPAPPTFVPQAQDYPHPASSALPPPLRHLPFDSVQTMLLFGEVGGSILGTRDLPLGIGVDSDPPKGGRRRKKIQRTEARLSYKYGVSRSGPGGEAEIIDLTDEGDGRERRDFLWHGDNRTQMQSHSTSTTPTVLPLHPLQMDYAYSMPQPMYPYPHHLPPHPFPPPPSHPQQHHTPPLPPPFYPPPQHYPQTYPYPPPLYSYPDYQYQYPYPYQPPPNMNGGYHNENLPNGNSPNQTYQPQPPEDKEFPVPVPDPAITTVLLSSSTSSSPPPLLSALPTLNNLPTLETVEVGEAERSGEPDLVIPVDGPAPNFSPASPMHKTTPTSPLPPSRDSFYTQNDFQVRDYGYGFGQSGSVPTHNWRPKRAPYGIGDGSGSMGNGGAHPSNYQNQNGNGNGNGRRDMRYNNHNHNLEYVPRGRGGSGYRGRGRGRARGAGYYQASMPPPPPPFQRGEYPTRQENPQPQHYGGLTTYIPLPPPPVSPVPLGLPIPPQLAGAPLPAPVTRLGFPLDSVRWHLLGQLEYYMSHENMASDLWLRQQMSPEGWVPILMFSSFNRIKQLTTDSRLVREVFLLSSVVEFSENGEEVRMRGGEWERYVLPATRNDVADVDGRREEISTGSESANAVDQGGERQKMNGAALSPVSSPETVRMNGNLEMPGEDEGEDAFLEEEEDEDDIVFVMGKDDDSNSGGWASRSQSRGRRT